MKYRKATETDLVPEEGKETKETTIINFINEAAEGFKDRAEIKMPKSGRIDFKRHILPYLLSGNEADTELTALTENATATIAIATDGNGNVCLRCRELTSTNARE